VYEFTSHYPTEDAALELTLKREFDRVADAPNASSATFSVIHEDGGHQTFMARFESLEDARTFRAALAAIPEADAHVRPQLEDLEPQAPARIAAQWSEAPPAII
jgi:hypothetical protein